MKNLVAALFSMVVYVMLITPLNADTARVISEEEAGDYYYTVLINDSNKIWEVGFLDQQTTLKETANNQFYLEHFRESVNQAHLEHFELILYTVYFFVIVLTFLIMYTKFKRSYKHRYTAIFTLFALFALYLVVSNYTQYNEAITEAKSYYTSLLKMVKT